MQNEVSIMLSSQNGFFLEYLLLLSKDNRAYICYYREL